MDEPEASGKWVAFPTEDDGADLLEPGEAQALAMNLLAAASEAEAHRLAADGGEPTE